MKFRYCFYCKKPVTKQNFRSRHLHADLNPKNKMKDNKEADKKKKDSENFKTKRSIHSETEVSTSNEDVSTSTLEKNTKDSLVDNNDEKESSAAPQTNINDDKNNCFEAESSFERPSKIRKI